MPNPRRPTSGRPRIAVWTWRTVTVLNESGALPQTRLAPRWLVPARPSTAGGTGRDRRRGLCHTRFRAVKGAGRRWTRTIAAAARTSTMGLKSKVSFLHFLVHLHFQDPLSGSFSRLLMSPGERPSPAPIDDKRLPVNDQNGVRDFCPRPSTGSGGPAGRREGASLGGTSKPRSLGTGRRSERTVRTGSAQVVPPIATPPTANLRFLTLLIQDCRLPATIEEGTTLIQRGGGIGPTKPQQPPAATTPIGQVLSPTARRWEMRDRGSAGAVAAWSRYPHPCFGLGAFSGPAAGRAAWRSRSRW